MSMDHFSCRIALHSSLIIFFLLLLNILNVDLIFPPNMSWNVAVVRYKKSYLSQSLSSYVLSFKYFDIAEFWKVLA